MFLRSAPGAIEQNVAQMARIIRRERILLGSGLKLAFRKTGLRQKRGFHCCCFGRHGTGKRIRGTCIYKRRKLRSLRKSSLEKCLNYVKTLLKIHTLTAWK